MKYKKLSSLRKTNKRSLRKTNKRSLRKTNKRSLRKTNKRSQFGGGINNILKSSLTIVFGRMSCPYTSNAIKLLKTHKIKHIFYDITNEVNKKNLDSLKEKNIVSNTWNTIPVIIQNKIFVGGMTELNSKLSSKSSTTSKLKKFFSL